MLARRSCLMMILLLLFSTSLYAGPSNRGNRIFEKIFSEWTAAFNRKDLKTVCALFSPDVVASYQGYPPKNYQTICDGFNRTFQDKREYQYRYKLYRTYLSEDLAAVRITWYLTVKEGDQVISETQDEGLDIFQINDDDEWKIVEYLGYPKGKKG